MSTNTLAKSLRLLRELGSDACSSSDRSAQAAIRELEAFARNRWLAHLNALAADPVQITDDGTTRFVAVLRTAFYACNRDKQEFYGGTWGKEAAPGWDVGHLTFDTYLPLRRWRQRVQYTLQNDVCTDLFVLFEETRPALTPQEQLALHSLCNAIVESASKGLSARTRLRALFPTKVMRRLIRQAMQIDPALMALARAALFRTTHPGMSPQWLTFVWRNQSRLALIRRQTPRLLKSVAQHMFQFGGNVQDDPTQAFAAWLTEIFVTKHGFKFLGQCGERPFREVIARFGQEHSLEALRLGLWLSQGGRGAEHPRPAFLRVTMDIHETTVLPDHILGKQLFVPGCVWNEARARFRAAGTHDQLALVSWQYRVILDWWVAYSPLPHAEAGWARWLALAQEEEGRRKARMQTTPWPSAVEQLRTPTAEVLALCTPLALFEEGCALRHCAYLYVDYCQMDRVRLFAARMCHQGRTERATIGLRYTARGWRIWDIRGACNRRLGGHWIPLARKVAETYTRRAGSSQLSLPVPFHLPESRPSGK